MITSISPRTGMLTLSRWLLKGTGTPLILVTWKSVWWKWKTWSSSVELRTIHFSTVPYLISWSMRVPSK